MDEVSGKPTPWDRMEALAYSEANRLRLPVATDSDSDRDGLPLSPLPAAEVERLVRVGAARPDWDDRIDVGLRHDPRYCHVLLTHAEYAYFQRRGEIAFDPATGYPEYTGTERLRGA